MSCLLEAHGSVMRNTAHRVRVIFKMPPRFQRVKPPAPGTRSGADAVSRHINIQWFGMRLKCKYIDIDMREDAAQQRADLLV